MNVEAFLEKGAPRTYKEWKRTREMLIDKCKNAFILSSESELRATFAKWSTMAKQLMDPETEQVIIRRLTLITLISFFQRDHDVLGPYRSFLTRCLADESMFVVRVASKVMEFFSRESIEGNCVFAKTVQRAKGFLQSQKAETGLVLLARARFAAPSRVMHVILTCVDRLCELGISSDETLQKLTCKLLKFGLERSESVIRRDLAERLLRQCVPNIQQSVNIMKALAQTVLDMLKPDVVLKVKELVLARQNKETHFSLCELALAISKRKRNRTIMGSEFLNVLVDHDYFILVKQALSVFDKKYWDVERLVRYLERKSKNFECDNQTELCPMTLLLLVIREFEDIQIDTSDVSVCTHFVECLEKRPDLLPDKLREYYGNLIDFSSLSSEEARFALAVWRICFQKLILDPEVIHISYERFLADPMMRIEFMKNAVADNSSEAQDMLLTSALFDSDDSVRLFCAKTIKPTVNLAFKENIFCLLNDVNIDVRRAGIRLMSKLNKYNPLLVSERVLACVRNHIDILGRTEAIYTAANISYTLPSFSKYFANEIQPYVHKIIEDILVLVGTAKAPTISEIMIGNPVLQEPAVLSSGPQDPPNATSSLGTSVRPWHSADVIHLSLEMPMEAMSADGSGVKDGKSQAKRRSNYSPVFDMTQSIPESPEETVTKARNIFHTQRDKQKDAEPNKSRIRQLFSTQKIDRRDACFCKTIAHFGMLAEPWLTPILNMFCFLLETKKDEEILISIVKSLRRLSQKIYNGLNIRLRCPQLIQPLTNLIVHSRNKKLGVCIIKLFGSSFDTLYLGTLTKSQMNNDVVYTSTTDHLFESMFTCFPTMALPHFAAMTMLFESDPVNSAKYVQKVVPIFMRAIMRSHDFRKSLFGYLTVIVSQCKVEFEPLLPEIVPDLILFFDEVACVKFFTALSYFMHHSFEWVASELYVVGLRQLVTNDAKYFAAMVKFLVYSIIFQKQPLDIFLEAIQQNYFMVDHVLLVFKYLRLIIQTRDVSMEQTRIFQLAMKCFDPQLLFSLVVFLHLPATQLRTRFTIVDCEMGDVSPDQRTMNSWWNERHPETKGRRPMLPRSIYEQLCNPPDDLSSMTFLEILRPHVKVRTLSKPLTKTVAPYFTKLTTPSEVHCPKWIINVFESVAKRAPSPSIRACISLFPYSEKFASIIGIIGFANCWTATTQEDRNCFSAIIQRILNEHTFVDNEIFIMIETCERVGIPMNIDYLSVVRKCSSHDFALYCLEKYIKMYPTSSVAFDLLMNLFLRMGYIATTKGTFETKKQLMDKMMIAKWSGNLGNWTEALRIYEREHGDFSAIVNCYDKIGEHEKLYSMKHIYEELSDEQRDAVNDGFFLAFLEHRELDTVRKIIHSFAGKWSPYRFLLAVNFYIDQGEYVKAQKLIDRAFEFIAKNKNVFICGDQSEITKVLNEAQLFIDCQEILNFKMMKTDRITNQRVKGFRRDKMMWRAIIVMKNRVVPISSNIEFYSKVISALRKDGQFELIDTYFRKTLEQNGDFLTLIKIGWARNEKERVCELCRSLVECLSTKSLSSYVDCMSFSFLSRFLRSGLLTDNAKQFILDQTHSNSVEECLDALHSMNRIDQHLVLRGFDMNYPELCQELMTQTCDEVLHNRPFLSRFYRIASRCIFDATSSHQDTLECQKMLLSGLEIDQNDFRLWKQWGYINVRLYSNASLARGTDDDHDTMLKMIRPRRSPPKEMQVSLNTERRRSKNCAPTIQRRLPLGNIPLAKSWHALTPDSGLGVRRRASGLSTEPEMSGDVFAVNAITGFLKATLLRSGDSLEFLCQLFGILFTLRESEHVPKSVYTEIQALPSSVLLSVIPQLTAHISYEDDQIRKLVHNLVLNVANDHFQEMFFPLLLYSKFEGQQAVMAQELLRKLQAKEPEKYSDAWLFTDGMARSAATWIESWMHAIDSAVRLHKQGDSIGFRKVLTKEFERSQTAKCELDKLLLGIYKDYVANLHAAFKARDRDIVQKLIAFERNLKARAEKLSIIVLTKVSEDLASRHGLSLYVPGVNDGSLIESVEPVMEILPTQQRPRVVYIKSNTGAKIKYLLKGNEDLRLDERFMQFFQLVNQRFSADRRTRELGLSISRYSVIPITVNAGLIQWVTGADTLYQIVSENRKLRNVPERIEQEIMRDLVSADYAGLTGIQKLEMFEEVRVLQPANELFEWMWVNAPNSQQWMYQNERYTRSLATMSVVGYIIGLGDRHPGNIMIQKTTGDVIHIDFGESFESASLRERFPEKVPFRLTRLLVNNLCGCDAHGFFRMMAQSAMATLRNSITSLIGQLFIFIHDPLNPNESRDTKKVDRVASKLHGTEFAEGRGPLSVVDQVDVLIRQAENPANYVRHYPGWCPMW